MSKSGLHNLLEIQRLQTIFHGKYCSGNKQAEEDLNSLCMQIYEAGKAYGAEKAKETPPSLKWG